MAATTAVNNLKAALRDRRRTPADGEVSADATIRAAAAVWLRELDESDRAIRTKLTYRDVWTRHVEPGPPGSTPSYDNCASALVKARQSTPR